MGCTNSTERKPTTGEDTQRNNNNTGKTADNTNPKTADAPVKVSPTQPPAEQKLPTPPGTNKPDYKSLRQVVLDAEDVLRSMSIPDDEKKLVALSFINTLSDVLRQSYRLKREAVAEAIEDLCSSPTVALHRSVIPQSTHGAREEFLSHLITAWIARNPTGEPTLPSEIANEVLLENQITPWKNVPMRFADCYRELLRIGDNEFTNEVFRKYAEGNLTITAQQFLHFLVDCQQSDTATMKIAEEKSKERFGAVGTRFTFALYLQSLTLNTAQDPRRSGTVWQDMTQPLPQYMVRTTLVESEEELQSSLATGFRAVVVHCRQEGDKVMAGEAPLDTLLGIIKEDGFTASNYPLVLCLAPELTLTLELQSMIAKSLTSVLGDELLAKGMMFEGATIKDPKFSPAALQHKVLVLASQAPLKPFVGFLVADMNRNGLGVKVTNVVPHTPAAKAGVQKGDWFTHINNEQIESKSHLKSILAKLKLGEEFTMRRENLDDVTIVVGGTIQGDEANSKELSDLVFLKFINNSSSANASINGATLNPWDVSGEIDDGYREREVGEGAAEREAVNRENLSTHFSYTILSNPPYAAVSAATHNGVQLICTTRSTEDQKWSRGFFTDNGECGYVQKSELVTVTPHGFSIRLRSPPPHFYNWTLAGMRGTMFGEGDIVVDEENRTIEVTGTDDLSVVSFLVTLMPPAAAEAGMASSVRCRPSALPTSPNKAMADAIATPIVLSVSFPVSVLRLGIRAFAALEEKDEGKVRCMPHYPILAHITSLDK